MSRTGAEHTAAGQRNGEIHKAMNHRFIVTLAALLGAVTSVSSVGQTVAPLIVSYIYSDGELVPVARFDGRIWRNTWPEPIPDDAPLPVRTLAEIPRAWLGGPVPLTWTAWSPTTGQHQRVRVTGIEREGSCVESITLATSPKQAPADGLAFSRPTTVNPILELEDSSREWDRLRREVALHFRAAINKPVFPQPGDEELGAQVLAHARTDRFASENVVLEVGFRDPGFPVFFIEAIRHFRQISSDTNYDAVVYSGWFSADGGGPGRLRPISASVAPFSTAQGKLPRYTPVGILRVSGRAIWVLSEWGIESQTIVLFDVSGKGVRKLTSAEISGC
jgi:hypothetical protein